MKTSESVPGAYSAGALVHPFVLLNYTGTLDSQFTLAHEMGHALHSYLSNHTQPTIYQDYVIFVAEVASTCTRPCCAAPAQADDRQAARSLPHQLSSLSSSAPRSTARQMFAEFELQHRGAEPCGPDADGRPAL